MFALISGSEVVGTSESPATLAALGPGDVIAVPEALLPAARAGYRLVLTGGQLAEELTGAKARLWERVKERRLAVERGGCATPLGPVDTDAESVQRITGAVSAAQMALAQGEPFSLDWTMADDSVVTHDATQLIQMGLAVMAHTNAAHVRGRALRAAIEAAQSAEDLAAIDIESGWPE